MSPRFVPAVARLYLDVRLRLQSWLAARDRGEGGQATAEYALVLLGVAAIALMVVAWATHSDQVGKLFNAVFDQLLRHVK